IATDQGETNGVEYSPDGRQIAATGDDGTVRLWDVQTRRQLWSAVAHEAGAYQVGFTPDGKTIATCGKEDKDRLCEASTGQPLGPLNVHSNALESLALSPQGIVAAGDRMLGLTMYQAGNKVPLLPLQEGMFDPNSAVQFSDHGFLAYVSLR